MRVCLDLRTASGPMHGIARYGLELVRALLNLAEGPKLLVLVDKGDAKDYGRGGKNPPEVIRTSVPPYSLLEQIWIRRILLRHKPDLYHCVTYACPVFPGRPFLFTIHDLLPLTRKAEFGWAKRIYFQFCVRWAAHRSGRVLVVSRHTGDRVSSWLPRAADKVRITPLGGDHIQRIVVAKEDREGFSRINPEKKPFFLTVANSRRHKNIRFALERFLCLSRSKPLDGLYILVGVPPQAFGAALEQERNRRLVKCLPVVSDGLLRLLYENAVALLFPCLGEGFGLPVVEAMQFGLPVLAVEDGAVPEVLGDVGVLVERLAPDLWEWRMWDLWSERIRGGWNTARVLERAQLFRWDHTARMTVSAYEELSGSRSLNGPGSPFVGRGDESC
mgnify:CR=1 FL=1